MKSVYLNSDNIVREILPDTIPFAEIAEWYNHEFASHCIEAPDEVKQGWKYDRENEEWHSLDDEVYDVPNYVIQEIIDGI